MFQDRMNLILNNLNAKNNDIAEYAATSPVTIGRYRMGKRIPRKGKPAVQQLVDGLIRYAEDHGQSDVIYRLLAAEGLVTEDLAADKAYTAEQLHTWLYADTPADSNSSNKNNPNKNSSVKKKPTARSFSAFAEKLGEAMNLAGLSNSMLAHMINADPSMISRFRRGHRTPKSSSGAVMLM